MKRWLSYSLFVLLSCSLNLSLQAQSRGIDLQIKSIETHTPYAGGFYRALIIGNNVYKDKTGQWPTLSTAVSDARAVRDLLRNQYGFNDIEMLENASRRDVLKALDRLSKKALPDDNILVYYAGHGFLEDETQRGYWVPVDAEGVDSSTFLRNSTIRDELNLIASRARHTLLISDSCFSGALLRQASRGISTISNTENYFKKVSRKKSVQIMSAGGMEFVDDNYQSSGHSPFTYFLLNELKNNDRELITLSELSNSVTRAVANNVDQIPESGVLQGAGDELGEFIFIRLNIVVDGVDPENVEVQVNVLPAKNSADRVKHIDIETRKKAPSGGIKKPHVPMPTL